MRTLSPVVELEFIYRRSAQALYHDIENLELYVGMQAEESKTPQPGAGLCPGFTMSRAILSDAVCLTRGDRFMTIDFTRTSNSTSSVILELMGNRTSSGELHSVGIPRLSDSTE